MANSSGGTKLTLDRVSLCGVTSLSDVLPELAFPSPLPPTLDKSLLFSSTVTEKSQLLGRSFSDLLLNHVTEAIDNVSTQHIELKCDRSKSEHVESYSTLVQTILTKTPQVFNNIAPPGVARNKRKNETVNNGQERKNQSTPTKSSFMVDDLLDKRDSSRRRNSNKTAIQTTPKKSKKEIESEELDFLLAQSLSGGGIADNIRSRSSRRKSGSTKTTPDVKIKPRNMKKSSMKPAKFNLKKNQRKPTYVLSSDDDEDVPEIEVDLEDLKHENIAEPPPETEEIESPVKSDKENHVQDDANSIALPVFEEKELLIEKEESRVEGEEEEDDEEEPLPELEAADVYDPNLDEDLDSDNSEDDEYIPKTKKISLLKKEANGKTKTKTLREIKVEKAEQRKKDAEKAKVQLTNEDDMADPLDSAAFKRFCKLLDIIFDHEDEMVPENFKLSTVEDDEDDFEPAPDTLLSLRKLGQLSAEAAKLKHMKVLNCIPQDRLVRLLNILDRHIRDSVRLQLNPEPETLEVDLYTYQREALQRMQVSAEACICSFHILTSPNMPKAVYLEDVIERTVMFIKFHLVNDIYPAYDPVYADPKGKDDGQSVKSKRKRNTMPANKLLVSVYNKIVELMELVPDLLIVQMLPDTLILQISGLSVSPFFVENVGTLQLAALSVCRGIFCLYDKHRQIILDDIFSSLARLPSSKRNFRSYTLSNGESIQMVTALVLQLIQCIIKVPGIEEKKEQQLPPEKEAEEQVKKKKKKKGKKGKRRSRRISSSEEEEEKPPPPPQPDEATKDEPGITLENGEQGGQNGPKEYHAPDADVLIVTSYEQALVTAHHFLSAFLSKCSTKEQEDYRPLFENFIEDLLTCLNLPEWPSAENVLNLLGRLLVATFSSKHSDFAMRAVTIEYLGNIAAHLRRDAVNSLSDLTKLKQTLVEQWTHDNNDVEEACPLFKNEKERSLDDEDHRESVLTEHITDLQLVLLSFLVEHSDINPELVHARRFYLGQWIRDTQITCEQLVKNPSRPPKKSSEEDEKTEEERRLEQDKKISDQLSLLEAKKDLLKNLLQKDIIKPSVLKSQRWSISSSNAVRIAQFLASSRSLSINFDIYLNKILMELQESAIGLRTKAMKALAAIISADPNLLHRSDMRLGVHGRFLDQAASVREAAVDLVGRFVLDKPQLTLQYYPMLSERILDKGIGVRKRVIKILRDICTQQPDFPKLTEICIKLIRRINDEDGIRELVAKVFMDLWFNEGKEETPDGLIKRVVSITETVAASPDQNCDWFKLLLNQYLKPGDENTTDKDEDQRHRITRQSKKLIDCLVDSVLKLENFSASNASNSTRLVSCLHTIYLFAEAVPHLVARHCTTLHPYLNMKCAQQMDYLVLYHVTRTLELVLPLMEHPSDEFMATVEEDMMSMIMRYGQMIVQACISCLGVIINTMTHNFKLAQDSFKKFFICLAQYKKQYCEDADDPALGPQKGVVVRSLFTVGLLCQHFEFDQGKQNNSKTTSSIQNQVYEILMFFAKFSDEEIRHRAITGLGFFFNRYDRLMLREVSRQLYIDILKGFDSPVKLKCQVLKNLQLHLLSDEKRLSRQNQQMRVDLKRDGMTDLKTYGDDKSTVSGAIAQMLLAPIHHCFFHKLTTVRSAAVQVICLVLHQGLLHPISCIQYLVAMCTDIDEMNRVKAEQQLIELDSKYPLFLHSQFYRGLRESFKLQTALFSTCPVRGFRNNPPISLLSHVYAIIRTSKTHRRSQLVCMIKQFDDYKKTDINLLLYIADNLAHLSYMVLEEPLFVIHHVALLISTSGTTYLEQAKDAVYGRDVAETIQDEDEEEIDEIDQVEDLPRLTEVLVACQSCTLLILLKKHLMTQFNLTDKKCHEFSPLEASKVYDKQITRHTNAPYDSSQVLSAIQQLTLDVDYESEEFEKSALQYYKEFRDLMTQQDLSEFKCSETEDEDGEKSGIKYYERRKELPVRVRKERKPRVSKTPQNKKRKLSKTPLKKQKKKKRKYVMNSDSAYSEVDQDDDSDYEG